MSPTFVPCAFACSLVVICFLGKHKSNLSVHVLIVISLHDRDSLRKFNMVRFRFVVFFFSLERIELKITFSITCPQLFK